MTVFKKIDQRWFIHMFSFHNWDQDDEEGNQQIAKRDNLDWQPGKPAGINEANKGRFFLPCCPLRRNGELDKGKLLI